ncbi:hypothetical protein PVT67_08225 [Gallaecimonas kandeliae]|uniref:hypothetical protein n=1 Tax=Gallaecimonas kandeliae TaxID=3029055 RepID=UPI00264809D0|nr:hypothetical protein [Gallaecimonas kandeliae]WKE67209.1 hypothetical protein PVT67_08225 [Gallaecimonas kandeliae]
MKAACCLSLLLVGFPAVAAQNPGTDPFTSLFQDGWPGYSLLGARGGDWYQEGGLVYQGPPSQSPGKGQALALFSGRLSLFAEQLPMGAPDPILFQAVGGPPSTANYGGVQYSVSPFKQQWLSARFSLSPKDVSHPVLPRSVLQYRFLWQRSSLDLSVADQQLPQDNSDIALTLSYRRRF